MIGAKNRWASRRSLLDSSCQCLLADDRRPFPNAAVRGEPVQHLRVGASEILRDRLVLTREHQHRAIDGIRERSGDN
jgi:hypothetical protein